MRATATDRYDYVIIGAGSAGCVLANRLTEDPSVKVLVLEAGGRDSSLMVRMPAGLSTLLKTRGPYNWGFQTEPEPHLEGRRLWWPRGKGLGGSSSINAMIYIRGHARDYDAWRDLGLAGWSYAEVLPYFKRSESFEGGADAYHGGDGPLHVSRAVSPHPIFSSIIEAGRQAGHLVTEDFNGSQQEGWGRFALNIRDGRRWSAATAFLHPALRRPNLTCVTEARTTRILVENGRAIGVEYVAGKSRQMRRAFADAEVLLCAGTVQSPHLLQLSGIGDPEELRAHGIASVHALKGVGANLQDHLNLSVSWECPQPITNHSITQGLGTLRIGLEYLLFGSGLGRQNFVESGAFLKSRPGLDRPDLQLHCVLAIMVDHGRVTVAKDGFTLYVCQLRPESRGRVRLASADPLADPAIFAHALTTEEDRRALREGVRIARSVVAQPAMASYRGGEHAPGAAARSDAELDAWIRRTAETIYHPVGTCRMGVAGDPMAVVDAELRVQGLAGLRVVDASVMPTLVGGNTHAPTVMIAEKAADLIRGRPAPAPLDVPVF